MNIFAFLFADILAKNAGAPPGRATQVAAVSALMPYPMGLIAAVALGRAAAPAPPKPVVIGHGGPAPGVTVTVSPGTGATGPTP